MPTGGKENSPVPDRGTPPRCVHFSSRPAAPISPTPSALRHSQLTSPSNKPEKTAAFPENQRLMPENKPENFGLATVEGPRTLRHFNISIKRSAISMFSIGQSKKPGHFKLSRPEISLPAFRIANRLQIADTSSVDTTWLNRLARVALVAMLAVLIFPFLGNAAEPAPKKLKVVTTIFPLYCFASGVIGSEGTVQNLLPPNVGPHDYQLSPSDLRKIKDADVIIMNGLGLDDWIKRAIDKKRNPKVIVLGDLIPKASLLASSEDLHMDGDHKHSHDHKHGPNNPHIWLDPQLAMQSVSNIAVAIAPQNPAYQINANAYIARLKQLDTELATLLAPLRNKPFVTQHDAFPYLVKRYQLKQVGILEPTPDVSPSPRFLSDLLKVTRDNNVPVIFIDPRSSTRLARRVASDAKIRAAELDTLESGKLDPLGYEQGMRRNAATLVRELK